MDLALFIQHDGSRSDITCSNAFRYFLGSWKANARLVHYEINDHEYNKCYYLANDIYREWSTLVNIICGPTEEKYKRFTKQQEACRKDVERTLKYCS
jgi:hypothetical protein